MPRTLRLTFERVYRSLDRRLQTNFKQPPYCLVPVSPFCLPAFHLVNQLFVAVLLFLLLYDRTVSFPAHSTVDLISVIALCRNRFLAKDTLCVMWEGQKVQQQSDQLQHGKLATVTEGTVV